MHNVESCTSELTTDIVYQIILCAQFTASCALQLGFCTVYYLYVARNLGGVIGLTTFEAIAVQVCQHCIQHTDTLQPCSRTIYYVQLLKLHHCALCIVLPG
jgi:hypothetical protein